MSGKSRDIQGTRVTREEVLRELGSPTEWWKNTLTVNFRAHLRGGAKELDLRGIIGSPGSPGYLAFLQKELEHPFGSNTGMAPHDVELRALAEARLEISAQIEKYEAMRDAFLKDPSAVELYVEHVKFDIKVLSTFHPQDPELWDDDESKQYTIAENARTDAAIAESHKVIAEYIALAAKLRATP